MNTTNDGWVKMSERRPQQKDFPVWYFNGGPPFFYEGATNDLQDFTHWKCATLPEPPANELTQLEQDTDALSGWVRSEGSNRFGYFDTWHAALAYRDKQNAEDLKNIPICFESDAITTRDVAIRTLRRRCGLDQ